MTTYDTAMAARIVPGQARPTLLLTRRYDASVERVWRALSQTERISAWWAPMAVTIEPRPGSAVTLQSPGQEPSTGEVLEAVAPQLLAFTWDGDLLRWELSPDGDGTVLRLTTTVVDEAYLPHCAAGWHGGLQRLADLLADRQLTEPEFSEPLVAHYRQVLAAT